MDIDTLTDEVMRRLMKKIQEEQATNAAPTLPEDTPGNPSGCCAPKTGKLVVTQDKAASSAPGSIVTFPQGTIITPLARDTFKERGVRVEFE